MSTSANPLSVLGNITGTVQIAAMVGEELVPVIIGVVKEVKLLAQGETIEYTVALSTGTDNLTGAATNFQRAIDLINAQRHIAGLPPLDPIPQTPVAPVTP